MLFHFSFSHTAIECPPLPHFFNGMITYSPDTSANYPLNTTATYNCSTGYFLNVTGASKIRMCQDDDGMDAVGEWSDDKPTCVRKLQVT